MPTTRPPAAGTTIVASSSSRASSCMKRLRGEMRSHSLRRRTRSTNPMAASDASVPVTIPRMALRTIRTAVFDSASIRAPPRPVRRPTVVTGDERSRERFWCERGDSNPHGLPHWHLKPARLPVPPLSHVPATAQYIASEAAASDRQGMRCHSQGTCRRNLAQRRVYRHGEFGADVPISHGEFADHGPARDRRGRPPETHLVCLRPPVLRGIIPDGSPAGSNRRHFGRSRLRRHPAPRRCSQPRQEERP